MKFGGEAMIKIGVKIQLKKEVLDTRGRTLLKLLQKENPLFQECRYGKYVVLSVKEKDHQKALKQADQAAKNILHNDLIETYELEIIKPIGNRK